MWPRLRADPPSHLRIKDASELPLGLTEACSGPTSRTHSPPLEARSGSRKTESSRCCPHSARSHGSSSWTHKALRVLE